MLLLQKSNGGWPKNIPIVSRPLSAAEIRALELSRNDTTEATIDNKATSAEMLFLAKMYQFTGDTMYRAAFNKGLHFLFTLQYEMEASNNLLGIMGITRIYLQ